MNTNSLSFSGKWDVIYTEGPKLNLDEDYFHTFRFLAEIDHLENRIEGRYIRTKVEWKIKLADYLEMNPENSNWQQTSDYRYWMSIDPDVVWVGSSNAHGIIYGEVIEDMIKFDVLDDGPTVSKYVHKLGEEISLRFPNPFEFIGNFRADTNEVSGKFQSLNIEGDRIGKFVMRRVHDNFLTQ